MLCMIIIGIFRNNLKVWNPGQFRAFLSYSGLKRAYWKMISRMTHPLKKGIVVFASNSHYLRKSI